jgi:protein-S-isoprenylcysteine O-methyltransferase Ste14
MKILDVILQKRMYLSRILGVFGILSLLFITSAWETHSPLVEESLFFAGMLLVAVGVVGRVWCLGYLVGKKARKLVTEGPFSLCRNPLYLFSFLGVLGVCLCTETMTVALVVMPIFVLVHLRAVRNEEAKLLSVFGGDYESYVRKVPRFIPSFRGFVESDTLSVNGVLFRKGIMEVSMFIVLVGVIEVSEAMHEFGVLPSLVNLF